MAVTELEAELVTPAQAARMLRRSKVRVLQLTDAGRLPCVRTPLGRLLPATAVRDFVRARDGQAPAESDSRRNDATEVAPAGGEEPSQSPGVTHADVIRLLGLTGRNG